MNLINEENIIHALKDSPILNPDPSYIRAAEIELIQRAEQMTEKKRQIRTFSLVGSTVMALLVIMWVAFYNGHQVISQTVSGGLSIFHAKDTASTSNKPLIYIFHSHNQESFLPELPNGTNIEKANSKDVNITLVGKYLSEKLNELGVNTLQDHTDYSITPNFSYADSYNYSRQTLQNILDKNRGIRMVFDIHRDSLQREKTTVTMNTKEVARIQFVVESSNPNYRKNVKFVNLINIKLENLYPGLSKGVLMKQAPTGSFSYNQDLSPNSVLVEIGGPENSLEEEYRAVDMFANVIEDVWSEME